VISLGAIALAGGKSSRMGTDKALLEINGSPLLQKVCEIAQVCGANPIYIITPWQERYQSIALPQECHFIHESEPQSPLTGFALGLSYFLNSGLKTDWILLLACDLPNLKSDVIKLWSQELINLPSEAIAYLPRNSKGWEPMCGFYHSSCAQSLETYIQTGQYSFQGWLSQCLVMEIPDVNPEMLFNCNTAEDYLWVQKNSPI
jgi:molybdenum cofactor guanylyltransferase